MHAFFFFKESSDFAIINEIRYFANFLVRYEMILFWAILTDLSVTFFFFLLMSVTFRDNFLENNGLWKLIEIDSKMVFECYTKRQKSDH